MVDQSVSKSSNSQTSADAQQTLTVQAAASISGVAFYDDNVNRTQDPGEAPVGNFGVALYSADEKTLIASTTTDQNGGYTFNNVTPGTYSVRFNTGNIHQGDVGTVHSDGSTWVSNVVVGQNQAVTLNEGLFAGASMTGSVYTDANGNGQMDSGEKGLDGITVSLLDSNGKVVASDVTSNTHSGHKGVDGVYSFSHLAPGDYTVAFTPPSGTVGTNSLPATEDLTVGQTATNVDLGVRDAASSVTVSGTVYNDVAGNGQLAGDGGLAGANVILQSPSGQALRSTVTAADGSYHFSGIAAGSYNVVVGAPEGYASTTPTTVSTGALAAGQSDKSANFGLTKETQTDNSNQVPASTTLNVILRGQSNSRYPTVYGELPKIKATIEHLLGFNGTTQTVNVVGTYYQANGANTEWGGTAVTTDWLSPVAGNYANGWTANKQELGLLTVIGEMTPAQRKDPTAILWLHNENDSLNPKLTAPLWESAVRSEASMVRGVLGQSAASVPYMFVNAIPFADQPKLNPTQSVQNQAIRVGQEDLVNDPTFNAGYAARQSSDLDMNVDVSGGTNKSYGNFHMNPADADVIFNRIALSLAEEFKASALPGSPIALASAKNSDVDQTGPQVVRADTVGTNQLLLTMKLDPASSGLAPLGSAAAVGAGWSLHSSWQDSTVAAQATAAKVVDANHLLLTFDKPIPANEELFYGWGDPRIAVPGQPGIGAAVYDDHNMPAWVDPKGLAVTTPVTLAGASLSPSSGTVGTGTVVTFTLDFSDKVYVAGGTPLLKLSDGEIATYTGGSGTNALQFSYKVATGDSSPGLYASNVVLNGATIADAAGNAVSTVTTAVPGYETASHLVVDGSAPASAGGGSTTGPSTSSGSPPADATLFGGLTTDVASPGGKVYALFKAIHGTAPDALSLEHGVAALEHGKSLAAVARSFLGAQDGVGNRAFVSQLYTNALGRQPSADELATWVSTLKGGTSRARVAVEIATSQESRSDLAATFADGIFVPDPTASAIARLHYAILDHAPSASSLTGYEAQAQQGTSLRAIARELLKTPEAAALHDAQGKHAFVTALFEGALGHAPGAHAEAKWASGFDDGTPRAAVAVGIAERADVKAHLAPAIETGFHLA